MARASATAENGALSGITAIAPYLSVHTADPGTTGASEVSGGSPAYARQSITWGTPASGSVSNTNAISVNIPTTTTVAYDGTWSAVTAGNYQVGAALTSSQTFNSQGTLSFAAGAVTLSIS